MACVEDRVLLRRARIQRRLDCLPLAHLASPFGNALRASRDSPVRAEAIGIDVRAQRWTAFMIAGAQPPGFAGALFAFSKGSISPETLSVPRSVDGLVMVLGGVQTLTGPGVGSGALHLAGGLARARDRILARRHRR